MGVIFKAFVGSTLSHIGWAIFWAAVALMGYGAPNSWFEWLVSGAAPWVTPGRARGALITLAAVFVVASLAQLLWPPFRARQASIYKEKDWSLNHALYHIGVLSADARARNAFNRAKNGVPLSERLQLHWATVVLTAAAANGAVTIRGWLAGASRYEDVLRDFWIRLGALHVEDDKTSLWRVLIVPRSGVDPETLPKYDSLIVDASQVEALWPLKRWKTDMRTHRLIFEGRRKRFWKHVRNCVTRQIPQP